jgi:signal peptidase I
MATDPADSSRLAAGGESSALKPPRPWLAAVLALLCNGLGHLYAGRTAAAVSVQVLWVVFTVALASGLRAGPGGLAAAAVIGAGLWLGQAAHARAAARRMRTGPRPRSSHLFALIAFYIAATALSIAVATRIRSTVAHTVFVPGGSMIPTVQIGDYLAVASGRPAVLRGAVVEIAAPPGSQNPAPLLKRIVAIAGDSVEIRDGALWVNDAPVARAARTGDCRYATRTADRGWLEGRCLDFVETLDGRAYHTYCTPGFACGDVSREVVPAGRIWVAGDHRDHSADSRVFGPVAESSILGEVRWVLASWGPLGPRWERSGAAIR